MDSHELELLDVPTLLLSSVPGADDAFELSLGCACGWSSRLVISDPTTQRLEQALERAQDEHRRTSQLRLDAPNPTGGQRTTVM